METVMGARVSSRLSERKRELLDRFERLGHAFGCIHEPQVSQMTDVQICPCTTDEDTGDRWCHNCRQTIPVI